MLKLIDWVDINKIDWKHLSKNPNAIELLKENKNKINWSFLSKNQNALDLLKENQKNICRFNFSKNPNIFTYNYKSMKKNMKNSGIVEELMSYIFHPRNMEKWKDWGFTEHQEMLEFINK